MQLAFGMRNIPDNIETAWGARLIWPADPVWDRQDLKGPDADVLKTWLNGVPSGHGALGQALARMREDHAGLSWDEDREVVLYEDEDGIIKANPQGSFGYLYVAGWLK